MQHYIILGLISWGVLNVDHSVQPQDEDEYDR